MCNKERKLVNEVLKLENLWSMGGGRERKKNQKILALAIADKEQLNFFLKRKKKKKKKRSGMERWVKWARNDYVTVSLENNTNG